MHHHPESYHWSISKKITNIIVSCCCRLFRSAPCKWFGNFFFFRSTVYRIIDSSPQSVTHVILSFWSKTFEKGCYGTIRPFALCYYFFVWFERAQSGRRRPVASHLWFSLIKSDAIQQHYIARFGLCVMVPPNQHVLSFEQVAPRAFLFVALFF